MSSIFIINKVVSMKINLILALIIYITSYAVFSLCFVYELFKTRRKYKAKLHFMHKLVSRQEEERKALKEKLKEVENVQTKT